MNREERDRDDLVDEMRTLRRELIDLRQQHDSRQEEGERYRAVFDNLIDGIISIDEAGNIESFNRAAETIFGYEPGEVIGRNVTVLMPEAYGRHHQAYIAHYIETGEKRIIGMGREVTGRRKDGSEFPMEVAVSEFFEDGRRCFTGIVRDITERKHLEDQLLQAQKMETVGQLAGGIAHDFNNQLGIILFDVELLLAEAEEGLREDLQKIRQTVLRAANLTRQLLVFSRRQRMEPQPVDLNLQVREMRKMISRLLGDDVEVELDLADNLSVISADLSNIDQIIVNLCVNARDAMPEGGRLLIETSNVEIGQAEIPAHAHAPPGRYCQLVVRDSGTGMDESVRLRVFEPFFTTKDTGKGTGLGLSVVYGIVEAHGGWITVDSKPGQGSCFRLFLPTDSRALASGDNTSEEDSSPPGAGERVLLLEDELDLQKRLELVLSQNGYRVTSCPDIRSARRAWNTAGGDRYHLLLTDVVLPDGRGPDFALPLRERDSQLGVIILTGFTDDRVDWDRTRHLGCAVLNKPIGVAELLESMRDQLSS
ncbi:MAG: PAS domain S-box protein [Candidatus Latescibacterota bacterium]|nr:PAS domain S-box protein [Candidatus Latescibacterota bacterium]